MNDKSASANITQTVFISSMGGSLEMYDFVIYVFFSPIIAKLFFPPENTLAAVLSTYGIFAVGYLIRPLGALIFGHYGDRVSRKKGLIVTILLMGIATMLMGLLPTYQHIGVWAPILLVTLRLLQGIAVGGDLAGAITFVAEHVRAKRRGLHCAWVFCGVNVGLLLASFIGTLITDNMTNQQLLAWGWRLGFLFSVVLLVLGVYFRRRLDESPIYQQLQNEHKATTSPITDLLKRKSLSPILIGIGIMWLQAVVIAQVFLYTPAYLHRAIHLTLSRALFYNTINLIIFSALIPIMGIISDKIGRKKLLLITAMIFIIFTYPLYLAIDHGNQVVMLTALFLLGVKASAIVAAAPATLTELFPTPYRYSGVAISYNIGFAIFAGLTPLFATWLITSTNNMAALALNLILAGFACLIASIALQDHTGQSLESL